MPNKIESELTPEALDAFVTALAAKPGKQRTLEAIKAQAAAHGISISLSSAAAFKSKNLDAHLAKLRRSSAVAEQVREIATSGGNMADAAAHMLSQEIFDRLIAAKDDDAEPAELDFDALTLAVSRLRRGDQQGRLVVAALAKAQAELARMKAAEDERQEKIKAAAKQLDKLRDTTGGISDAERAAIVATVDDILGIKVVKKKD